MSGKRVLKDLTGQRFGRLTVLWRGPNKVEPSGAVRAQWVCRCDCGEGHTAPGHSLTRGLVRSCGCLVKEKPIKHGMARKPVYRQWAAMLQRCGNPNNEHYGSYGARGIAVCERWKSFEGFFADMGDPGPGMTLERIDNGRGYEPGNVRWASRLEQAQNRRTNEKLTFAGQTLTLAEWGRVTGFGKSVIVLRRKRGWPVERILTEPLNPTGKRRTNLNPS